MARTRITDLPQSNKIQPEDLLTAVSASVTSPLSTKITVKNLADSLTTVSSSISASYAATASSADNFFIRQNITASNAQITGTIVANKIIVNTISSSIIYSSGSNIFGDELTDVQQFTGSVKINGTLSLSTGTADLTSSWAQKVQSSGIVGDVVLGTQTSGNYVATVTAGSGLSGNGTGEGSTPTIDAVAGAGINLTSPVNDAINVDTGSSHFIGGSRKSISVSDTVGVNGINLDYNQSTGVLSATLQDSASYALTASYSLNATTISGNTNRIAKFTSPTALGNSIILEDSNTLQITGSTYISGSLVTRKFGSSGITPNNNSVIVADDIADSYVSILGGTGTSLLYGFRGDPQFTAVGINSNLQYYIQYKGVITAYITGSSSGPKWYMPVGSITSGSSVISGSLDITGSASSTGGFTGSLSGTSSYAITASYALNGGTGTVTPGGINGSIQFNSASVLFGIDRFRIYNYNTAPVLLLSGSTNSSILLQSNAATVGQVGGTLQFNGANDRSLTRLESYINNEEGHLGITTAVSGAGAGAGVQNIFTPDSLSLSSTYIDGRNFKIYTTGQGGFEIYTLSLGRPNSILQGTTYVISSSISLGGTSPKIATRNTEDSMVTISSYASSSASTDKGNNITGIIRFLSPISSQINHIKLVTIPSGSSTPNTVFVVNDSGSVGINKSSPSFPLDINGNALITGSLVVSGSNGGGVFSQGATLADYGSGISNSGSYMVWRAPFPCYVVKVYGYREGGGNAEINAVRSGSGGQAFHTGSNLVLSSTNTWISTNTVQNTDYSIGDSLKIVVSGSGGNNQVAIQVDFLKKF